MQACAHLEVVDATVRSSVLDLDGLCDWVGYANYPERTSLATCLWDQRGGERVPGHAGAGVGCAKRDRQGLRQDRRS